MYRKGDIVVRLLNTVEGGMKKGTRAIVKEVLNDKEFTLEGHEGVYLQSSYRLDSLGNSGEIRQVSDLESVEQALRVIDNWNRTHPTAYMISMQAYPAQDGGTVFMTSNTDFNSIEPFVAHLANAASDNERRASIQKAIGMLQMELDD